MPATPAESLTALLALLVLTLVCRWVFSPAKRQAPSADSARAGVDYGLLISVTTAATAADAAMLREVLLSEGIRASVGAQHEVLVFATDLERARELVGLRG